MIPVFYAVYSVCMQCVIHIRDCCQVKSTMVDAPCSTRFKEGRVSKENAAQRHFALKTSPFKKQYFVKNVQFVDKCYSFQ